MQYLQPAQATATDKKRTVHVLYGLSGNRSSFLGEFEISLKSVLMNSPIDSDFVVHIMADQNAYRSLAESFERTNITTWKTRNQVTIEAYNVEPHVKRWGQFLFEYWKDFPYFRHTIGAFFRLFVNEIVDENYVDQILYIDTDAVVTAQLDTLWVYANKKYMFIWGNDLRCSGFMIITVSRLKELWDLVRTPNFHKQIGHSVPDDQLIFRTINEHYPDLVGYLPKEWDVSLADGFMWKKTLNDHRPDGVGMIHLNGGGENGKNAFDDPGNIKLYKKDPGWGNANYYVRIPWSYAKFITESMNGGTEGHSLILHYNSSLR